MIPSRPSPSTLAYWQQPQGAAIPFDPLKFLYIPDEAEHMMVSWLAQRVFDYQRLHAGTDRQITQMVMITMGALLPGVLLHDYVTYGATPDLPAIEFGTFGVKFYKGPGEPLTTPQIVQPLSIDVRGHIVGIVEDMADLGKTARYVRSVLMSPECGARDTLLIAPYRKSHTDTFGMEAVTCGVAPQDTWIITPRERVETMMKRVPFWASAGATEADCRAMLETIGYPEYLIRDWFPVAWAKRR
jgi:hypoxanthine phosphoribosyltransferase